MNYEDIETIGRIAFGELALENKYSLFKREVIENFNLANGYIYSNADLYKLQSEKRPTFQYNLFLPIIMRILGGFKNSIIGVDFIPKTEQDQDMSVVIKAINDFVLYQANDIEYEISKAFAHAVIGRIGWIKQDYIYSPEFPQGMIDIKFYDPFRIKIDLNTTRRDLKDCNYISDSGWYPIEDIINIYAQDNIELRELLLEKAKIILGESSVSKFKNMIKTWAERLFDSISSYSGEVKGFDTYKLKNLNEFVDRKDGLFKVIDWYEKRLVRSMILIDFDNNKEYDISDFIRKSDTNYTSIDWYDKDKLNQITQNFVNYKLVEQLQNKIFQTSIVPALNIVLYDAPHILSNFKFTPIFCYDIHIDVTETKSIVDFIKDPVKSANQRRNTMLTYITRIAHGGWIAEESAIKGFMDDFLSNDIVQVKRVRDGSLSQGRIQQITIPQMPTALDKLQLEDMEFVKYISGVRDNALASSESANESGVLFRQKVFQSELIQEWISDNGQSALLQISKNNLEYIQKLFTEERIIRIIDRINNQVNFLTINKTIMMGDEKIVINDVTKGSFDVIISKTPYGKAQRETEFNKLITLAQLIASINPAYIDPIMLIEASGLKSSQRWIEYIKNQNSQLQQQLNQQISPNPRNVNLENFTENVDQNIMEGNY